MSAAQKAKAKAKAEAKASQGRGNFNYDNENDFRLLRFLSRTQEEVFWITTMAAILFYISYDFTVKDTPLGDGTVFLNDRTTDKHFQECQALHGSASYPFFFSSYGTFKRPARWTIQHTTNTFDTSRHSASEITLITDRFLAPNIWGWDTKQYVLIFDLPDIVLSGSFEAVCDFFRFWFTDFAPFSATDVDTLTVERAEGDITNWTFLGCSFKDNQVHTWKAIAAEFTDV